MIEAFVSDPLSCPEGWIGNDATLLADNSTLSCYFISKNYSMSYLDGIDDDRLIADFCKERNSFPVSINDKAENEFVRSM